MKKIILFNLLILAIPFMLFGGVTGKISGKIVDKATGEALPGVNVIVEGTSMGAATNLKGEYFIINMPPGVYDIKVTYIGYKSEVKTTVRVWIDKTTPVDFEMVQSAIELGEINIVAYRPDVVEKDVTATKLSYDVGEISSLPGITDVGDILNLQADVDGGHFRGSRSGEALYLVSGASIVNPLTNSRAFEPMTIGLQQVEVYTSGFSAEYGNVQSGVVNMVAKEGSSSEWKTHFDVSSTNSYYKTHGGSVFSKENITYFDQLNSNEEWAFETDPISGVLLWSHFGLSADRYLYKPPFSFPPKFATTEDTLRTASLIRALWLQSMRDIGLEYDKPDYRFEFSTGGPIAENMTFFVAAQQNIVQPFLPTGRPDISRRISSNITYKPNPVNKIQLLYNYAEDFDNDITDEYTEWFERTLSVGKENDKTHQFAVSWNRVLNQSTFFDIKLSQLYTKEELSVDLLGDSTLTEVYTTQINWRDYTAPTGYEVGKLENATGADETKSFTLNSSITNQINQYNLLKAGLQFNYYDIDISYLRSRSSISQLRTENYKENPYEGAVYFQDKMEFEGMIANIGGRLDFYNFNTEVYTDKFSPYRTETGALDASLADKKSTSTRFFLQPRVGISFPVSEAAVLHLNYGVFTQRPAFNTVFAQRLNFQDGAPERLGNSELEPERTISYDIGLVHGLPLGFYLDVSAYLKDTSNLLQFSVYEDDGGNRYFTFDNREYANIKGFQVNVEKKGGRLRGYLRYNWESAKGKSGSAIGSGARTEFFENEDVEDILPSPEDIFLDYNRKHKLVGNVSLNTGPDGLMGISPLADISMSATYRLSSGRPFTYDPLGQGLQMNQRTPTEHDLRMRLNKTLSISTTDFNFYLEVFNVLNHKVFDYGRTFQDAAAGELNQYAVDFVEDRDNLLTDDQFAPYLSRLEGFLYGNQPRHYRFGIEFDF